MLTYQIDGLIHFRAALSRPSKSLRKRGNVCFHAGNYSEAAGHYTVALHQLPRGQGAPRCACGCLNTLRCPTRRLSTLSPSARSSLRRLSALTTPCVRSLLTTGSPWERSLCVRSPRVRSLGVRSDVALCCVDQMLCAIAALEDVAPAPVSDIFYGK